MWARFGHRTLQQLMATEGSQKQDVDQLRHEVEEAIADAIKRLRATESVSLQHLRATTTERQHLEAFIDELHYRLKSITNSGELPQTITGPLTESQLHAMQGQEETLAQHKAELGAL